MAKLSSADRKRKKELDSAGVDDAYKTKGKKFKDDELGETFKAKELAYDPHFITASIIKFGKVLTGLPLYTYQEAIAYRIIYSIITFEGAVLSVLLSRQSGKSETMAFVIDTLCVIMPVLAKIYPDLDQFKDGIKIGLFAPQSDQVYTTYNRAMLRLTSENAEMIMSDPEIDVEFESKVRLQLTNGSYLKGQVASKQSKIESKTYDIVIIEEAQDLDTFIVEKSIEPMVSATAGTIIKVGTTGTSKNHFWHEIQRNRNNSRKEPDERLLHHLEFDYKKIILARRAQYAIDGKRYHLNYEQDVLRKRQRLGEESQSFKLAYALKWDLESGMLVTEEDYDKICNKKKGFGDSEDGDIIIAGLDIAKDINSTVITIGRKIENEDDEFGPPRKEVLAWVELHGIDYEAQHHLILDTLVEWEVDVLFGDYTGVGKAVIDRLMYACGEHVHIEPITFGRQSKSDLYYGLTSDIATKRIKIPANKSVRATPEYQHFEEQMKNCTKYFDGPFLVCEKGDGFMDDYCDSLALMCAAGNFESEHKEEAEESDDNPLYSSILAVRKQIQSNS